MDKKTKNKKYHLLVIHGPNLNLLEKENLKFMVE